MQRDKKGRFVKKFQEGSTAEIKPAGVKIINLENNESDNEGNNNKVGKKINKEHIADTLELFRLGLNYFTNKKIGELAKDSTKPVLEQVSDVTLPIYGNYRSLIGGLKSAADIRNSVSTPLTSDSALYQNTRLLAEIEAQNFIAEGLSDDEDFYRKSIDRANNLNVLNLLNRSEKANTNMKTLINYGLNLAGIEIDTLSNNVKDVASPFLGNEESRFRSLGEKQQFYQDKYDLALIDKQVWYGYSENLTDDEKKLKNIYNTLGTDGITEYLEKNPKLLESWDTLNIKMSNEIIRRQAALKGVDVNIPEPAKSSNYGIWGDNVGYDWVNLRKKGGNIKLIKHTNKDKTESNKRIAKLFLENTINQIHTYRQLIPKKSKKKYQTGGNLPFVSFTPVSVPESSHYLEEQDDTEDLTTKDILEILNDMEGLDSDREAIIHSLKYFSLNDPMDPLGLSPSSNIVYKYATIINNIKKAKNNKEWFDKAYELLRENYALDELAVTKDGYFIGVKEGDYEYISPYEVLNKAKEGYSILTNSNLLYLRNTDPNLAFETATIAQAASGISMQQVTEYLNETIKGLGSDRTEYTVFGGQLQDVVNGLKQLQEAAKLLGLDLSLSDLYEATILTEHLKNQIMLALTYLYLTLPTNMKSLLIAKGGSEEGALNLINNLIHSKTSNVYKVDFSPKKGSSSGSSSSSSSSKKSADNSELESSLPLNVLKNIGGVDTYIYIDKGDGIRMTVRGTLFNQIKTPSGQPILDTSLSTMLQNSGLLSIVKDMRNIQFGDQKISPEALSFITYNNTGLTRVNLPVKSDGSVDLDLLELYQKAENDILLLEDKSIENIKSIYDKYEISSLLNSDGTYNQSRFAPFMITEGYTTDALSGLEESDFVKEYKGDANAAISLIKRSLLFTSGKNVITPEIDEFSWWKPGDWFGWTDKIFKGVIYIPITNNVNTAVYGANQSIDYDEALIQELKYLNFEKMSNLRSTSSDLLNM